MGFSISGEVQEQSRVADFEAAGFWRRLSPQHR